MTDLYKAMFSELGISDVQVMEIEKIRSLDQLADVQVVRFEMGKHHPLGYVGSHFSVHAIMDNPELYMDLKGIRDYFCEQGFDVSESQIVGDNAFTNVDLNYLGIFVTIYPGSIRGNKKPDHILDHYWHKINPQ